MCAMVKAPTVEEEDRRRLCRERNVLIAERIKHINRVKGLLFSQLDFAHFRAPVSDGGPKDRRFRDDAHGLFDR
jgi:transposase